MCAATINAKENDANLCRNFQMFYEVISDKFRKCYCGSNIENIVTHE